MMVRKGCWTCKDRKVQCDGSLPACRRCLRAMRRCQGYELRLSWPKQNNKKRALTSDSPTSAIQPLQALNFFFINATQRDLKLYHDLSLRNQPVLASQLHSESWDSPRSKHGAAQLDLVHYFQTSAYLSLATFDKNPSQIRDTLLRMAVTPRAEANPGLLQALLAFSALRLGGLDELALRFKVLALHSLSDSTKAELMTTAEATQYLATSLLLGSFEILLPSGSSDEWLWHIWGSMDIIQAARLERRSGDNELGDLLDWFYYNQTLSRFPIHHWRHRLLTTTATHTNSLTIPTVQYTSLARHRPTPPSANPTFAILNLLSEACDTILDPWDPRSRDKEYDQRLETLEGKLANLSIVPDSTGLDSNVSLGVEMYQIATRIYLTRATQSSWESSADLDSLIDRALSLPVTSCQCTHFFPLFIVACEARTDTRRAAILSLVARAEESAQARNMAWLKGVLQSVWVQHDLHADSEILLDYLGMISAVISSSQTIPSFV